CEFAIQPGSTERKWFAIWQELPGIIHDFVADRNIICITWTKKLRRFEAKRLKICASKRGQTRCNTGLVTSQSGVQGKETIIRRGVELTAFTVTIIACILIESHLNLSLNRRQSKCSRKRNKQNSSRNHWDLNDRCIHSGLWMFMLVNFGLRQDTSKLKGFPLLNSGF